MKKFIFDGHHYNPLKYKIIYMFGKFPILVAKRAVSSYFLRPMHIRGKFDFCESFQMTDKDFTQTMKLSRMYKSRPIFYTLRKLS